MSGSFFGEAYLAGLHRPRKRRVHPADLDDLARIEAATSFSVAFVKGPFERYRVTAGSIEEAREIEERLNREHGEFGRRAIVYALDARGAVCIPSPLKPGVR